MMDKIQIKFKKLDDRAQLPTKAHESDTCFDIYSIEDVTIPAQGSAVVPTGLQVAYIQPGYSIRICSRSGLGFKYGIKCHEGEVDSGYRGNFGVKLYNHSSDSYTINAGDRCAQFKIQKVIPTELSWSDDIEETNRGSNGFGSSGK